MPTDYDVPVRVLALATAALAVGGWHYSAAKTTTTYKLTLRVGPSEAMYTRAQVTAQHPKSGEVMVGGAMGMGSGGHAMGMEGGGTARHLEVHVRLRSTGEVLGGVMPTITLADQTMKAMPSKLQVVAMEGIGAGMSDLHYGNDVALQAGHRYSVVVSVKGERATFAFVAH